MIEVSLVAQTTTPITWTVEAINMDGDGGVENTMFSGPNAEKRARDYAEWGYSATYPPTVEVLSPAGRYTPVTQSPRGGAARSWRA